MHFHHTHKLAKPFKIRVKTFQRVARRATLTDHGVLHCLFAKTRLEAEEGILLLTTGMIIPGACKIGLTVEHLTFRNIRWLPSFHHPMSARIGVMFRNIMMRRIRRKASSETTGYTNR